MRRSLVPEPVAEQWFGTKPADLYGFNYTVDRMTGSAGDHRAAAIDADGIRVRSVAVDGMQVEAPTVQDSSYCGQPYATPLLGVRRVERDHRGGTLPRTL